MQSGSSQSDSQVASSREDAWIETLWGYINAAAGSSRPPARTRGLKQSMRKCDMKHLVASSREDAWIETAVTGTERKKKGRVLPRGRVD